MILMYRDALLSNRFFSRFLSLRYARLSCFFYFFFFFLSFFVSLSLCVCSASKKGEKKRIRSLPLLFSQISVISEIGNNRRL
ncbi:hypothetical protein CSUI_010460 [Cystoisospora suis]|uniref:Transmembrane protein n=1 Tax=Cystoisospora suis TaxID=483139 RepID=A0A2C6KH66_9APIC|nr:hypothetical protein CSUI_010460 [Cystoisospora suis]